jgi:hypothetical protein
LAVRQSVFLFFCQLIARKSVEPLAAHLEPHRVSARHQSLHHFVSKSEWSDAALIEQIRRSVLPYMDPSNGPYWIIDDTGFPKKEKHSVGLVSSGPSANSNQPNTDFQHCQKGQLSNISFKSQKCAGAFGVTIRISNRSLVLEISKGMGGVGFDITHSIAPVGFSSHTASSEAVRKLRNPRCTCLTRGLRPARVAQRMQLHLPDSITTLRWRIAVHLTKRSQRCPYRFRYSK